MKFKSAMAMTFAIMTTMTTDLTRDVLGTWKHYNLSAGTLAARNTRARSPLQSRELDRYC